MYWRRVAWRRTTPSGWSSDSSWSRYPPRACAVRESALHAVCIASTHYQLPYRVVEALAVGADAFEPVLLRYVLFILGATYDRVVLPVVERYLRHPDPEVRREAAEAVDELGRSREFARGESRTGRP
ncbi:HEAT repeat domain-containing protein [Streptomyces sp. NPDC006516]|uniref:HEAT repeat domain-containing protein n=1 Tax=Streptomyces sp. NPDC006516 TaxID=3154309 RepID=UPI0033B53975